jgi:amidophosphoribosyltransferase
MNEDTDIRPDAFNDECGVFGIFGDSEAANLAYLGLHALQHRGQEGAGIVASDGKLIRAYRGRGRVGDVFGGSELASLLGHMAIGHVRNARAREASLRNVQPFVVRYKDGQIGVAHNGNIVNAGILREELEDQGSIFGTSSDTEVILHLVAASQQGTFINRLVDGLMRIDGAYSLVMMTEETMVAVRDPWGFRPLVLGKRGAAWVVASETCALGLIDAEYVREVEPGEMVIIDRDGVQSLRPFPRRPRRACIHELVHFSRPDSIAFGRPVYDFRHALGQALAVESPVEADVVIPVPDSGVPGALGYSYASGIQYGLGLIRSHYVGGRYIEPSQQIRDFGVKLKLSPVRSVIVGMRVVVVDNSLVRGTTLKKVVRMLRQYGASEIHVRITSPPTISNCFCGTDALSIQHLIAARMNVNDIQKYLGADSLAYLSLVGLRQVEGDDQGRFCEGCFTAEYPIDPRSDRLQRQMPLFVEGKSSEEQ